MFSKKLFSFFAIFLLVATLIPVTASAWWIFSAPSYRITYDEEILNRTMIVFDNTSYYPEKIYYRIVYDEDETDIAVEFFLYWSAQTFYIATHEHDWEFVIVYFKVAGDDLHCYGVCYDDWHYVIGRNTRPSVCFDVADNMSAYHVPIIIDNEYHAPKVGNKILFGDALDRALDTGITPLRMTEDIINNAEATIGFDPKVFNEPFALWEKDSFGNYARYSAWKSWKYAILVSIDKRFDFFDFSKP